MMRLVSFGLCSGWQHMLIRQFMHDVFGEVGDVFSSTADDAPSIVPTVDKSMSEAFAQLTPEDLAWAHAEAFPKGQGSNSFVISGERSATGKPLLASDPHLPLAIPSFWYQVCLFLLIHM